jgi:hypothetical protein
MRMFELGAKALRYPDLVELAKHHMQMLSDATGETVHLGTADRQRDHLRAQGRLAPHAGHVLARGPPRAAALHRHRQGADGLGRARSRRDRRC